MCNQPTYPPTYHQEKDPKLIKEVAITYPFATLVSAKDTVPYCTHAPLILDQGNLIGHIDASNPQTAFLQDGYPVTAIFQGPQTYISPAVYSTKQLPTWNYVIAHARGTVRHITDTARIKKIMVDMTTILEAPEHRFRLDIDDPRMEKAIPYIHCFEIQVNEWEGKFKLSQDKNPTDIQRAKDALLKEHQEQTKDFINHLFLSSETIIK